MTTTARVLFDQITQEVEDSKKYVIHYDTSDLDNGTAGMEVLESLPLEAGTLAFGNYKVRDALLVEAHKDEEFAFVLVNKIMTHVKQKSDDKTIVQSDIEAVATASHILAMWELIEPAVGTIEIAKMIIEENDVETPNLIKSTMQVITAGTIFDRDISKLRQQMVADIGQEILDNLDNDEE
jgi:hypothetical protein